jgi:RND family efflux transporter MFP subunit
MTIFHKPKIIIPITAVLALVIAVFFFNRVGHAPQHETAIASMATVSGDVTLASTIESATPVTLAFAQGGRVATVKVHQGQTVHAGDILATLDAGTTLGALTQAKAALELAKAQGSNTTVSLETATAQQNVLVENAYRTLLSSSLAAEPSKIDEAHNPTVTGTYTCDKEGSYTITPYPSSADSGYSFRYSGLESGIGTVTFNIPQPLGTCGLFVTFASDFSGSTIWTISIPNTKSPTYVANKNAYDAAVITREKTLADIKAALSGNGQTSSTQAAIDAAAGAYQAALGAYQNTLITAPISGTVSFVSDALKVGQTVSGGNGMLTVTPENSYQIEASLSRDDATKISIGTKVTIALASGGGKIYHGSVISRTLAPTTTGGTETYQVVFSIDDANEVVTQGSAVVVTIPGETKENVLSIPRTALSTLNGEHSVLVVNGKTTQRVPVQTGVIGSDRVEILSGVTVGDHVVVTN